MENVSNRNSSTSLYYISLSLGFGNIDDRHRHPNIISISERSSGWATNYRNSDTVFVPLCNVVALFSFPENAVFTFRRYFFLALFWPSWQDNGARAMEACVDKPAHLNQSSLASCSWSVKSEVYKANRKRLHCLKLCCKCTTVRPKEKTFLGSCSLRWNGDGATGLNSIAVLVFMVILVEFDKYRSKSKYHWWWDEHCLSRFGRGGFLMKI